MFRFDQQESFPSREEKVLAFWQKDKIFARSVDSRKDRPLFSYYDGPPFATGLPHYGHILAGTIKDVVPRYKTMKGFYVPRRFGWDCHGLPVENEIEKAKELSGASAIEDFGIGGLQRRVPQDRPPLYRGMEKDRPPDGRWVELRRYLPHHGPRLHGIGLVGLRPALCTEGLSMKGSR